MIQLVVSERLHTLFPSEREGRLTRLRATLTSGDSLAQLARDLGINRVLRVSAAERSVRGHERQAALEDAIEALAAAIYIDSDWDTTRRVLLGWFGELENRVVGAEREMNPKGQLQELVQPEHGNAALSYRIIRIEGPPHEPTFEAEVMMHNHPLGRGVGSSKKEAEEEAARAALRNWPPAAT